MTSLAKHRRAVIFAVGFLVVGLIVGVLLVTFITSEPTYRGRTLSVWLKDLDNYGGEPDAPAIKALQEIGTNAVPTLLKIIRMKDSRLRTWIIALDSKQSVVRFQSVVRLDPVAQSERRWRAVNAFIVLGKDGQSAIPALERLLSDSDTAKEAASALARIGPQTLPLITEAVTNKDNRIRSGAIFGLAYLGPRGRAAIPVLIAALQDQDYYVRSSAAWALGLVGVGEPEVIAPLLKAAGDPHWNVRAKVAESLGTLGHLSPEVVAVLQKALGDTDTSVRSCAASSLQQLEVREGN